MHTRLFAILLGLWILAWIPTSLYGATSITALYGAQMACDPALPTCTAIPLQFTALCNPGSGCPIQSQPSLTDPLRFWGSTTGANCSTSIDGGLTWANCTVQPLTGGSGQGYAGASDGSVIGASNPAGTCTIVRSINNGTSWSTVFTKAARSCGAQNEGTLLHCLGDGRCVLPFLDVGANTCWTYTSTDNGQTWAEGTGVAVCNVTQPAQSTFDGTRGLMQSTSAVLNSRGWFTVDGSSWNISTPFPANVGQCWGNVVYNGTSHSVCFNAVNYTLRDTAGSLEQNLTLPSVDAGPSEGGLAYSLGTNNLYILASKAVVAGALPIGIWVTRDGSTFTLIATTTTTVNTMRGGDFYAANGCLYFSAGTSSMFGKIC